MAMPRVPGDAPQVSFQPTQMPGFAAPAVQPAQNFGPQQLQQLAGSLQDVGQASSRIGSAMQRQDAIEKEQAAREQERQAIIRQREQDRLDETSAGEAVNNFRMYAITKQTEFGKLEGKDAASQYSEYQKAITEYGDEIHKGLANPTQRQLYQSKRELFQFDTLNSMDVHAYKENKRYQSATSRSSAELNAQSYIDSTVESLTPSNESVASQYMSGSLPRIRPEVYKAAMESDIRASMDGQPEESIKVAINNATKQLHSNALEAITAKRDFDAVGKYVEKHEKEMDPKTVMDYRKIASSAKIDFDASKFAIQVANLYRAQDGFFGDEQHSIASQEVDNAYLSKRFKWSEQEYKAIKSALTSLKEADSGARSAARSDAISQANKLIDILKSPEARQSFFEWQSSQNDPSQASPPQPPKFFPITNDEGATDAFRQSDPVLHAKLDRLGLLDQLESKLKGGGNSDPNAIREIETEALRDPNFYAKYPIVKFAENYGLRLNSKDFNIHFDKMLAAQAKASESASALSASDQQIILNKALFDNGVVDVNGKDVDKNLPSYRVSANIKSKWSDFEIGYKQSNGGASPTVKDYKEFIKDFFDDSKVFGGGYKIGTTSPEDLGKVQVSFETRISGSPVKASAQFDKIDTELIATAQQSINDDNSTRWHVVINTSKGKIRMPGKFATEKEATEHSTSNRVKYVIDQNKSSLGGIESISVEQDPYVDPIDDKVAIGQRALQIMVSGEYQVNGKPLNYDANRRSNFIATQYGAAKSSTNVPQGFLGNYFDFMTQPFRAGEWMSWDETQKAYMESRLAEFDRAKKRIEGLRDDINSNRHNPSQRIDFATASMLTGYTEDELVSMGATVKVPVERKTDLERIGGSARDFVTVTNLGLIEKYVKDNYDLVTSKLKVDGIRQ